MPRRFTVRLTPGFVRDLDDLPRRDRQRVVEALLRLEADPFGPPPQVKKLKARGIGQWRLRVGAHRIRYDVIGQDVVLYRVRHRKDVYRA